MREAPRQSREEKSSRATLFYTRLGRLHRAEFASRQGIDRESIFAIRLRPESKQFAIARKILTIELPLRRQREKPPGTASIEKNTRHAGPTPGLSSKSVRPVFFVRVDSAPLADTLFELTEITPTISHWHWAGPQLAGCPRRSERSHNKGPEP